MVKFINSIFNPMNKNILIGILIVIIVALGGYAIWKTIEQPAPVVQVIDDSQNPTLNQPIGNSGTVSSTPSNTPTPPNPPSSNQQPPQTPPANVYTSATYHFQLNLPIGTSLRQDGVSWSANTPYGTPGLHNIDVGAPSCQGGGAGQTSNVTINGILFQRTIGTGMFGGMESNSIDTSYCTIHNNQSYTLMFTDEYDRVDGSPAPNQTATYQTFDQEMQTLDFAFTQ